ncbi:MAG: hypothetical protein H0U65_11015 [Rubrobacter sp.]|nr:hypothetical protein [Rubrobacter sp.]
MKTRDMTDEEIDRLGYEALKEKLGVLGAARFIGLQLERSRDDYMKMKGGIFEDMTVEEIYAEAARLESKRRTR